MGVKTFEIPNRSLWSQSIGGLIINFGLIEFQSMRWIQAFGGDAAVLKARRSKLSERIDAAVALIKESALSPLDQARACELWSEARRLSKMRNRIAHNPICIGRSADTDEVVLSIIDLKNMAPKSANTLEPLQYTHIASFALRAGEDGIELSAIIESTK